MQNLPSNAIDLGVPVDPDDGIMNVMDASVTPSSLFNLHSLFLVL
jgi:hypothetical protein